MRGIRRHRVRGPSGNPSEKPPTRLGIGSARLMVGYVGHSRWNITFDGSTSIIARDLCCWLASHTKALLDRDPEPWK